jgi:hypothetical protein
MKTITVATLFIITIITGCKKYTSTPTELADNMQTVARRACATNDVFLRQLAEDPTLRTRMDDLENFTRKTIESGENLRLVNGVIEIPVVVNVLYRTAQENISDAQIQSQIDVLNADFNSTNTDLRKVPSVFASSIGKVGVRFVLQNTVRKFANVVTWPANDAMKFSRTGGIDATDPSHNLNIWVCNLDLYLGYAYYPGIRDAIDGVVILYSAFGSRAIYHQGTYLRDYDLGRTASHEVGHWMNLIHIWGDDGSSCAGSDRVDDTPNQADENYGCPRFPQVSCSNSGDMSMNYMDYTDDACMYMFTKGQVSRMLAVFAPRGPRATFAQ